MCRTHLAPLSPLTPPPWVVRRGARTGFSLLELMVTLAIACIGLVIGVPSYQGLVERQRVTSAMHLLTAHMASARITAITYRIPTVVCPSDRAGGCRQDGDWSHGWLMFFDADGNRSPDAREDILRDENAPIHPSLRILSSSGRPQLRYLPDGRSAGSNISVRLCREDMLLGTVIVNNVGRIRSETSSGHRPCQG
ncbi:prepilin-type N-terminal cleavage/methylation domain-containing protein [Pseudoxanthomonas gei]|uniref:Type II secretion system protein H n=1 Tax=Pseudoxanthomonas gei TaxID=1383030 RepID=A0ABX0ACH5_9GAMM|nr:Tfp pilus assembly protein FimT/FimU [Pseudoxanthomonas gei]NDK39274.1 prepilin-type N-terminal cleavage/methylation domain-containing protein [Pseudoxanthomonas gei]